MTELKPCPFCGSENIKLNHYKVKENDWWYIVCPNCEIAMDPWRWNAGQTRMEAIEKWNRRAVHED